jgi:hypothetical protein
MDCLDIYLALPAEIRWMIYKMLPCKVQQVMELGYELNFRACASSKYYGRRPGGLNLFYLRRAVAMGHLKCVQYEYERDEWLLVCYLLSDVKLLFKAIQHCKCDMLEYLFELYERQNVSHIAYYTYYQRVHFIREKVKTLLARLPESRQKQKLISILKPRGYVDY